MRRISIVIFAAILLMVGAVEAGKRDTVTETVPMTGADGIVLRCELGAGEFYIKPQDMAEAAKIDITYDPRRVEYFVEFEEKRGKCYIDLESEHRSSRNIDTDDNIWEIVLSTRYETVIEMDIGACDAEFDLGGIPITEFNLDIGAASGVVEFSKPNPTRLREMEIDAGASSLEIHQLGNANFDYFSFDGGAGSFEIDLSGKYDGESEVSIDVGLGSADITLPEGLPYRIETDGSNWLSSIDIHNRDAEEVEDDVWESEDFEDADTRIVLQISVGMGSVDIYWK